MKPLINISHTVAAFCVSAGMHRTKVSFPSSRIHAHTVVFHGDADAFSQMPGGNGKRTGFVRLFKNAVNNGIFNNWLQHNFDNGIGQCLLFNIPLNMDAILKTHILNLYIQSGMPQFV